MPYILSMGLIIKLNNFAQYILCDIKGGGGAKARRDIIVYSYLTYFYRK